MSSHSPTIRLRGVCRNCQRPDMVLRTTTHHLCTICDLARHLPDPEERAAELARIREAATDSSSRYLSRGRRSACPVCEERERDPRSATCPDENCRRTWARDLARRNRQMCEWHPPVVALVPRSCLRCEGDFMAEGKYQRLCPSCRERAAGVDECAVGVGA